MLKSIIDFGSIWPLSLRGKLIWQALASLLPFETSNTDLQILYRGSVSSVGRAVDWRAGGRGFDSWGRTNTQSLKITEK